MSITGVNDGTTIDGRTLLPSSRPKPVVLHKTIADIWDEFWKKWEGKEYNLDLLEKIINDGTMTRAEQVYCVKRWIQERRKIK